MQVFIEIMDKIAQIDGILKDNKDFTGIIVYITKNNSKKEFIFQNNFG